MKLIVKKLLEIFIFNNPDIKQMNTNFSYFSISMKTFLVLVPLLGVPFLLGPFVEYNIYIAYIFVAMNGLSVSLKYQNVSLKLQFLLKRF